MRTEQDVVDALKSLARDAPDPDELMAAVRSGAARYRGNRLARRASPVPGMRAAGWAELLAPLGAAAAVAAIILAIAQLAPGSGGAGGDLGAGPAAPLGVISPTPGPPRFVLAFKGWVSNNPMYVFSAADGHQAGHVIAPLSEAGTATGNDRTFIISNAIQPNPQQSACHEVTSLYRLDLSGRGSVKSLIRLALPVIHGEVSALAATPDGRHVAYVTSACGPPFDGVSVLGVIDTATGKQRQWTWTFPGVMVRSLSITQDGSMIEYLANPNKVISRSEGQTLDTSNIAGLIPASSPPGPVARSGRIVLRWTASPFGSSAVTGNGQDIYYCVPGKASKTGRSVNRVVLRAYHLATASARTLATYPAGNGGCQLALSGRDLLIVINKDGGGPGHAFRYDLKSRVSSPFPDGSRWDQPVAWDQLVAW